MIEEDNPQCSDSEYRKDPYCDDELYDKDILQFKHDEYSPTDDEQGPAIEDRKRSRALIELWQPKFEAIPEAIEKPQTQGDHQGCNSLLDETTFLHLLVEKEGEPSYVFPFRRTLDSNLNGGCCIAQRISEN